MRISDWSSDVCSSDLRARSEAQRVRPAIHLEMVEEDRLQFPEIAIVVGVVDRHPVLEQRQPAHVIAAREARSAGLDAHLLPVARLHFDAGREGEPAAAGDNWKRAVERKGVSVRLKPDG